MGQVPVTFQRAHFGLVTLHGKESLIAPALTRRWQARLSVSAGFDTDSLGTFSGEVERRLSPLDCALHKARQAVLLTGAEFGLGSEGSFGPGPWGFGVFNQELVVCVSAHSDWTVIGGHTAPVAVEECRYGDAGQQESFWQRLPDGQGVIVISGQRIAKGLQSRAEVIEQLALWHGEQVPGDARLMYDLRAHQSLIRRATLALAINNLLDRLDSHCEHCGRPGFWPDHPEPGLPCADCGGPTNSLRARRARCDGCGREQITAVDAVYADPATCPRCNP
jgi:hypothetical protein